MHKLSPFSRPLSWTVLCEEVHYKTFNMKIFRTACISFVLGNFFAALLVMVRAAPSAALPAGSIYVRGVRYCEILPYEFVRGQSYLSSRVYNTFGVSDCPSNLWDNLTLAEIRKQIKATLVDAPVVVKNGPRYWMMTYMGASTRLISTSVMTIGGIPFRIAGINNISFSFIKKLLKNRMERPKYSPITVARTADWIWDRGTTAYILTDSFGYKFVMQSYSQTVDPDLSIPELSTLAAKLTLPKGWSYAASTLDASINVTQAAGGVAIVLQDGYENSYCCMEQNLTAVLEKHKLPLPKSS